MEKKLTLGSLFDGSGGFPLGGLLAGITPVWASEIEPFPIRVTTKRLPFMKHYGNISAMDGSRIEPVDIITFGSPCQDMSVATARDYGAVMAGYYGMATVGYCGMAMAGDRGAATAGDFGTAVSYGSSSTGRDGLCVARGNGCRVKGGLGSVLVITEESWKSMKLVHCKTAIVDGEKIKADTWYTLQDGEFSEVGE